MNESKLFALWKVKWLVSNLRIMTRQLFFICEWLGWRISYDWRLLCTGMYLGAFYLHLLEFLFIYQFYSWMAILVKPTFCNPVELFVSKSVQSNLKLFCDVKLDNIFRQKPLSNPLCKWTVYIKLLGNF